ncbi:hypothetical protein L6Q21_00280 [Sandaracinobacter sp. RS1-74]|uniref:hypothetical protein n=1 Tax=Sandaracinobacteroides sayramensis TaxID=2913411 RepID=UPI001EDBD7C5|nr:hypothetical protein [Sandaracinobacteroides sayramensis]MCG2839412.1 hypothetical protein [Sandaracinobacteroides sayramensis]
MTNPFEQFAALATANQSLFLKFAEISQAAMQRQAEIAARGLSSQPEQGVEQKPTAFSNFAGFSTLFQDVEQNRQASLAATREAVQEWQSQVGQLFPAADAQKQFADVFQAWSKPLVTAAANETEPKAPAAKAHN